MNNVEYKICAESFCHANSRVQIFKRGNRNVQIGYFLVLTADQNNWPTSNLLCLPLAFVVVTSVWIYLKIFWQYLQVNKKRILNFLPPPRKVGVVLSCPTVCLFILDLRWAVRTWKLWADGQTRFRPCYTLIRRVTCSGKQKQGLKMNKSRDISMAGCADVHNPGKQLQKKPKRLKQDHKSTKEHNNGHDDQ